MIAPPRPPSREELEALIKEARARQLRRRLLGAAAVAIAAALGLGIYAVSTSRLTKRPVSSFIGVGSPTCRSAQLSASLGFQAGTQMAVGGAEVTNIGSQACSLPRAWPRVRLTANGRQFAVAQRHARGPFLGSPARVLKPGGKTEIELQWGNWCGTPHRPVSQGGEALDVITVDFAIQFGSGLLVTAATKGTPPCLGAGPSSLLVGPAEPS
jgi:hypothetical protein